MQSGVDGSRKQTQSQRKQGAQRQTWPSGAFLFDGDGIRDLKRTLQLLLPFLLLLLRVLGQQPDVGLLLVLRVPSLVAEPAKSRQNRENTL